MKKPNTIETENGREPDRDVTDDFGIDPENLLWMCFWMLMAFVLLFGVAQLLGVNTNDWLTNIDTSQFKD